MPSTATAAIAAIVAVSLASVCAVADERLHVLSESGTLLGKTTTAGAVDDLRFTVDLQGDTPTATHVWATVGSSDRRVRTNEGYWLPWNGSTDTLIDNRFPMVGGKVVFKIMDENIAADNRGVTISIGYRVGDKLKYGVFAILPKAGSP